jgi:dsDNA-specific endonuclease/ATPase MutS2
LPCSFNHQLRNPNLKLTKWIAPLKSSGLDVIAMDNEILVPDMIDQRTIECLDFQIILDALCNNTVTILGRSLCRQKQGHDSFIIRQEYSMIDQLYNHIAMLPLRNNMNVYPVLNAIEYNLSPPEREDLYLFTMQIEQIIELYEYMILHHDKLDLFVDLTGQLVLPRELSDMFVESFDDQGELNGEKFPVLKKLRTEIEGLRGKIIQTLKTMLQSFDMREKLADR